MSLELLAKKFGDTPLYIVGGAVRNMILGVPAHDIDITSSMRADAVIKMLEGSDFIVVPSSLRMGTLIIRDGDTKYEYTAFRSDSYPVGSGQHTPIDVTFTDDINLDASRRDFRANAVYYNVLTHEYVDPLGGIEDIKNGVLSTTREPESVFREDGLRLMRLVRFASEMGFRIEPHCYEVAKSLVHLLADISVERITEELVKIMHADKAVYGNKMGYVDGMNMLVDMGAMRYIIPEMMEEEGVMQNPKYHDDDVLHHSLNVYRYSDPSIRLAGLMHDIGKPYEVKEHGNMYAHNVSGAEITRKALERLKFPTKVIEETCELVYMHMFDIHGDAKVSTIKKFILEHHNLMDKFLMLRYADLMSSVGQDLSSYYIIKDVYEGMKRDKVPMSIKELAIDGNDIKLLGFSGAKIGEILKSVLHDVAICDIKNEHDLLLDYVRGGRWEQKR